jgi:16S rRNA (uracil1498-N3)-methyltransferase
MIDILRNSSAHVFVESVHAPVLLDDDAHHLSRVLRLRDGESVTCSDGKGSWVACTWNSGDVEVAGDIVVTDAPSPPLTVAIAPVKGDRTDLVIEKVVEIGIDHIIILSPVERSVVRWASNKVPQVMDRYTRIARAAAMQSRRVFLPTVSGPVSLSNVTGQGVAFAEPGGSAAGDMVTTLVIGPEGGFSPAEVGIAPALADLGPSILRAETAAIVGAARMVAHWRR